MGLLDLLFGSQKKPDAEGARPPWRSLSQAMVSFSGDFLEIRSIGFFGQFKKSKSGEWVIGWSDTDEEQHRGGHRESGHGQYVLYNAVQSRIALQGTYHRHCQLWSIAGAEC